MHRKIKKILDAKTNLIAAIILAFMFFLMIASSMGDSLTRDELAHIVSGYSYLSQKDYRLNPEHPPLIKDLAAFPLVFMRPVFPSNNPAWTTETNAQWSLGDTFLFKTKENDADKIILITRLPMMLLALLLGCYIFRWTKELAGKAPALLALILFAFSPNIIAHSRLVATDLGIAFFILISFYYFWKYLKNPSRNSALAAGVAFGLAHLAKFSSPVLFPVFGLMLFMASFRADDKKTSVKPSSGKKNEKFYLQIFRYPPVLKFFRYFKGFIAIAAIAYLLVGGFYALHLKNMPVAVQHRLINDSIGQESYKPIKDILHQMADNPILRPYSQYFLGFFMVYAHSSSGHTTFFMGEMGRNWQDYYPIAYLIKEPIPSQIFFYLALVFLIWLGLKKIKKIGFADNSIRERIKNLLAAMGRYHLESAMLIFIILLLAIGANSKLQLGIRYILPIFPFLYILIALALKKFLDNQKSFLRPCCFAAFAFLSVWLALETIYIFPSYIAYYNEFIGGPKNGHKYLVDSNTDWGQDLKRLVKFVEDNKIAKIKLDYFGGADPKYYLGDKLEIWGWDKGPTAGWLAVSASALEWNRGVPEDKKIKPAELNYRWLDKYEPVAQIGYSIFVYNIE